MSSQKYLGYKKAIEKIPINVKSLPSLCVLHPGRGTALCSVLRMWSLDPCHLFCTFLITWRKGANSSTYDNKNLKFDIRSFRYVHKYLLWKWLHSYYCIYLLWIRQRSSCCLDDIFTYSFVSGLSMVTHKVFSYTLSRLGIPSHGICQNSENIQCKNFSWHQVLAINYLKTKMWFRTTHDK